MHELSIAQSLVEIAESSARRHHARAIRAIQIRLGEFTTVVPEALEAAFAVARRGTLAGDASLEIEFVRMVTRCVRCGESGNPIRSVRLHCRRCGLPLEIISGEELQIESIDIEPETERHAWSA